MRPFEHLPLVQYNVVLHHLMQFPYKWSFVLLKKMCSEQLHQLTRSGSWAWGQCVTWVSFRFSRFLLNTCRLDGIVTLWKIKRCLMMKRGTASRIRSAHRKAGTSPHGLSDFFCSRASQKKKQKKKKPAPHFQILSHHSVMIFLFLFPIYIDLEMDTN